MIQEDPKAEDHPIAAKAVGLLDAEDGRYRLSDRARGELMRELSALIGGWELPLAVDALLRLAHVLEAEWDSPEAAGALCDLIERDEVLEGLRALAQQAREPAESPAADPEPFRQFTGEAAAKKAPKVGETPPDGAVKVDAFKAPRRV